MLGLAKIVAKTSFVSCTLRLLTYTKGIVNGTQTAISLFRFEASLLATALRSIMESSERGSWLLRFGGEGHIEAEKDDRGGEKDRSVFVEAVER